MGSAWQLWATVATTVAIPVITAVGAVYLKRLSRRTENAAAHKTEAEATSTEVGIARSLLDDVRKLYSEQRAVNVEDKTKYEAEMAVLQERLTAVQRDQAATDNRLMILLAELTAHQPWDSAAYAALTAVHESYPPPPPFGSMHAQQNSRPAPYGHPTTDTGPGG